MNKTSRAVHSEGGDAYNSPTNKTLQDAGYGWGQYGDEVGTIGLKEPRKGKGDTKEMGKQGARKRGTRGHLKRSGDVLPRARS